MQPFPEGNIQYVDQYSAIFYPDKTQPPGVPPSNGPYVVPKEPFNRLLFRNPQFQPTLILSHPSQSPLSHALSTISSHSSTCPTPVNSNILRPVIHFTRPISRIPPNFQPNRNPYFNPPNHISPRPNRIKPRKLKAKDALEAHLASLKPNGVLNLSLISPSPPRTLSLSRK